MKKRQGNRECQVVKCASAPHIGSSVCHAWRVWSLAGRLYNYRMRETTCPYCNAVVPVPDILAASSRLTCERCGDSFSYRPGADIVTPTPLQRESSPSPVAIEETAAAKRWSNRTVAAGVLGIMLLMALIALALALQTTGIRREHDAQIAKPQQISVPLWIKIVGNAWIVGLGVILYQVWKQRTVQERGPRLGWVMGVAGGIVVASIVVSLVFGPIKKRSTQLNNPEQTPVRTVAPASLEALGFMPTDTNLIVAIHAADLMREPERKELLQSFLGRLSHLPLTTPPEDNAAWPGLTWEEIDHLVLGLRIDDLFPPRVVLAIRTRQVVDAEKVQAALKATLLTDGAPPRYRFKFGKPGLDAVLGIVNENTLLVGLTAKDLDAVPATPRTGIDHLQAPLRSLIEERVDRTAFAWVAAHRDTWDKTIMQTWLLMMPQRDREALDKMRTMGVWLSSSVGSEPETGREIVLAAAVECADKNSAERLKTHIEQWSALRRPAVKLFQEGAWITAQAKGDAATIRKGLQGGK